MTKNPFFLAITVLTLALGVGASTAIFSIVDHALLAPFPYSDASRLMVVQIVDVDGAVLSMRSGLAGPEYLDYAGQNQVFDRVMGYGPEDVVYTSGEGAEHFDGKLVTANTFEFLGVPAMLGRMLETEDYRPGSAPVFVLRYNTWVSHFHADPAILSKTFILNGTPRTLVGIMPPRFAWGNADLWIPETPSRALGEAAGGIPRYYLLVGHLKAGVTVRQAEIDLSMIGNRLATVYPKSYPKHFRVKIETLTDMFVGRFRSMLFIVAAAVGLLLLIGCSNVANLLLTRGATREKEFAIRAVLGAPRWRLIQQLLIESVLLAVGAAILGCLLAWGGLKAIVSLMPPQMIPAESVIRIDGPVLLFALIVGMFTALVFGLIPALRAAPHSPNKSLCDNRTSFSSGGVGHGRLRNAVVVLEVALSLTLLMSAGLLMKSFVALLNVNLGLKPDHVLVARLPLPPERYKTAEQLSGFFEPLLARLKALPGVVDASAMSAIPPYGGIQSDIEIAGKSHQERPSGVFQLCSDGYFSVLRIQFLHGRGFTVAEVSGVRKLAVVNQMFARKYLGNDNPIGARVRLTRLEQFPDVARDTWFEIIGVVFDVKNQGLQQPVVPEVWIPYTVTGGGFRGVLVRTAQDPASALHAVQQEIWAADSNVAPTLTGSLEGFINDFSLAQPRFGFFQVGLFAGIGLILVTVGTYSVIAYNTAQRTREIGIRIALGARRSTVLGLIVRQGTRLVLIGIAIGLGSSFALSRFFASQLWGVSPHDPATLALVSVLMLITGIAASWLPARRATQINPAICLRYE